MIGTNIYNLYCFSVIAQLLNYTKAAEVLNISQPALSKNIRALEKELGFPLFTRSTRVVQLTEAGQYFREKAIRFLNDLEQAVNDAKNISSGQGGVLRIGFLPYPFSEILPRALQKYCALYPDVKVIVQDGEEFEVERKLKNGDYDIAFLSDWGTDLPDEYEKKVLYQDSYCAVMSTENPLAEFSEISFEMLRNEKFLLLNQSDGSHLISDLGSDHVTRLCIERGFLPNIVATNQANTLIGLCVMTGSNAGISILASHMEKFVEEDYNVRFVTLSDVGMKFNAFAGYLRKNPNPCIASFLNILDSLL